MTLRHLPGPPSGPISSRTRCLSGTARRVSIGIIVSCMAEWWSVEVFHGEFQASRWQDSYSSSLIEAAISHGAVDWTWIQHRFGVVFEVCFADDETWQAFRWLPAVRAALDAVPDPVNGLLIYRGRGGGSGAAQPRRPRPTAGAGAVEAPGPEAEQAFDLTGIQPPGRPASFAPQEVSLTK